MDLSCMSYVSCIKIAKQSIIPPLLTEESRNEMRRYRNLAVSLEKRGKSRRNSADSGVMISSNDGSCKKPNTSEPTPHDPPLPAPDTSNGIVLSVTNSLLESDRDNVFSDAVENSPASLQRRHSDAILYPSVGEFRETSDSTRRSSYTIETSRTTVQDCEIPVVSEYLRNSYIVNDSHIFSSEGNEISVRSQRRNSYTLDSPSPIMLQYMQSLRDHDPNEGCELFIQSADGNDVPDVIIARENEENQLVEKELTLNDLVLDLCAYADLNSTKLDAWDASSDETLRQLLETDARRRSSLGSSVCVSPELVVRACESSECLKKTVERSDEFEAESAATVPAINRSCECICNVISNFETLKKFQVSDPVSPAKTHLHDFVDDSFAQDFHYLDLSNASYEELDTGAEGRFSECSSVSLNKFLVGDKIPDAYEAEYAAFVRMKEQLEAKHHNEFKRLLKEQQKEHDNLKAQFDRVLSLPKPTPSPKCNYAYSPGVVLKKYSPVDRNGLVPSGHVGVERSPSTNASKPVADVVESRRKISSPKDSKCVEKAAAKINAAVRGYLIRRLFKTERVTLLVQTIRDCLTTAVALQSETDLGLSELDLQSRLLQQLTVACNDLHDTFLLPVSERMSIIRADREKKHRLSLKKRTPLPLSEATRRTLQRKIAKSAPPGRSKHSRRRCKSASSTASDTTSCRSTPGHRRPLATTILSQKYSVSLGSRRPWR